MLEFLMFSRGLKGNIGKKRLDLVKANALS